MMMGISMVGFATVATNLWFIYKPQPLPTDRIKEHIKCLVGAGISVYTAFFAFGAVRFIPELALQPGLWAVPLIVGLTLIIYHQRVVTRPLRSKLKTGRMSAKHAIVIGAGAGGLAAGIDLARAGFRSRCLSAGTPPAARCTPREVDDREVDGGPTV
jgi:hypothetical protein